MSHTQLIMQNGSNFMKWNTISEKSFLSYFIELLIFILFQVLLTDNFTNWFGDPANFGRGELGRHPLRLQHLQLRNEQHTRHVLGCGTDGRPLGLRIFQISCNIIKVIRTKWQRKKFHNKLKDEEISENLFSLKLKLILLFVLNWLKQKSQNIFLSVQLWMCLFYMTVMNFTSMYSFVTILRWTQPLANSLHTRIMHICQIFFKCQITKIKIVVIIAKNTSYKHKQDLKAFSILNP